MRRSFYTGLCLALFIIVITCFYVPAAMKYVEMADFVTAFIIVCLGSLPPIFIYGCRNAFKG